MNSTTINRKINIDVKMKKANLQEKFISHKGKTKSFNNLNNSKTFKKHSSDLSFEGFSLKTASKAFKKVEVDEAIDFFTKVIGPEATKAYEKLSKTTGKGFEVKGSQIVFTEESILKNLAQGILYPVYHLPIDIANASLKGLSKVPFLKNKNWITQARNLKTLKNRREILDLNESKYRLWGGVEKYLQKKKAGKLDDIVLSASKGINPLKGDYNTAAERSLVRFTTGMVTAFYLGNDAYNLTRIVNDDHKQAKREKKSRFVQETSRVILTSYLIYIALESLKKYANKSLNFAIGATLGVTALAEIIGRKVAGKTVLPMSSNKAVKLSDKDKEDFKQYEQRQQKRQKTPISFAKQYQNEVFAAFQPKREQAMFEGKGPKETKGRFNIWKLTGGLGALILAGFALEKGTNIPKVKKVLNGLNEKYKTKMQKEVKMEIKEFKSFLQKLKDENYVKLADKYEEIVLKYNNVKHIGEIKNTVNLGQDYKKGIYPLVDRGLLSPFKFFYNTLLTGPYKFITNFFKKAPKKPSSDIKVVRNVLKYVERNKHNPSFKDKFSKKLLETMDKFNHTNYSSADLGLKTKIYTSLLTGLFLVSDNYNLVMLKTGGKDKALAEQKAQERAVQRLSRTYYSSTIIGIMNKLFEPFYNRSLLGAAAISGLNSVMSDTVTRWSVGLPTGESTREKIYEIEKENAEAKGIKGGFFRTMQFISGKQRLSEKAIVKS